MRFLRQSLTGLFLLSLTVGLLFYASQIVRDAREAARADSPASPERRERVFAVTVVTAKPETVTPVLTAFGEVKTRRSLEIRAMSSGTVTELASAFQEGGEVQAGQMLVQIDPADAQSALDMAKSDLTDAQNEQTEADRALLLARDTLEAARAQSALRDRAFARQTDLEARGVGTAAAVETAELAAAAARQAVLADRQALAQAEARVNQAATRLQRSIIALEDARRRLEDTTITADFSGTLSEVALVKGGVVNTNEKLGELIDPNALEVAFRVSTTQYARLINAQGRLIEAPVTITLEGFDMALDATGVLTRGSAAVGDGQTGRLLFARLDSGNGMKPGDFVTVTIDEPPLDQVVRLPASALGSDGQVLLVAEDERLVPLPVALLRRQGDEILVRADDITGAQVVAERSPVLGEGIKVRVLNTPNMQEEASLLQKLTAVRRMQLIAFVQTDSSLSEAERTALIATLSQPDVPAQVIQTIETRMGG